MNEEQIKKLIERVAPSNATVTIFYGNSDERYIIANQIHNSSIRKLKPIIILDCSSISQNLFESEFFGHEKDSFNGAYTRKIGLLEVANGGTIFLDNIHELAAGNQAKLLKFLQEGIFYRIGGKEIKTADVRVISGSSIDLEEEVMKNKFREDLFYRINTITFRLTREEYAQGNDLFNVNFDENITLHELEKRYILKALNHFNGNKTRASESLGITIKTLYNKIHEYGLET